MKADTIEVDPAKIHLVRVLDEAECREFVAQANESKAWIPAVSHGVGEKEQASKDYWNASLIPEDSDPPLFAKVKEKIASRLSRFLEPFEAPPFRLSRMAAARYEPGGHVADHADASPSFCSYRRQSFVCYLNDDYEGGMTAFANTDLRYRGTPGQSLLFPSHYLHRGEPVISGEKYILVFFLGDPQLAPVEF